MPKVKIARKSTWVDMTAFVDVAFLILTFFILATKFKPDDSVEVKTPTSVSSDKIKDKNSALILLDSTGRVFLQLGDQDIRNTVINNLVDVRKYSFTAEQKAALLKKTNFGTSFASFQSVYSKKEIDDKTLKGIPVDSLGGELSLWIRDVYAANDSIKWYVKADGATKYPQFKYVLAALKSQDQNKFSLITNPENIPLGSELDKANKTKK